MPSSACNNKHILFFCLMIRLPPRSTRTDKLFPYTTLFRSAIDTNFNVWSLKGQAGYQFSERLGILFNGERVFLGPYDGDITLSADARLFINDQIGELRMGALYQRKRPEFMFEQYYSSYHRWQNDYERVNLSQLSFFYFHPRLKLGLSGEY